MSYYLITDNGLVRNSIKLLSRPCYESILSENLADVV